jgi:hypothetical protein
MELSEHHEHCICVADSDMEAKIMYESSVTYIVQSGSLAAKVLGNMFLREHVSCLTFFQENTLFHLHDIQDELRQ